MDPKSPNRLPSAFPGSVLDVVQWDTRCPTTRPHIHPPLWSITFLGPSFDSSPASPMDNADSDSSQNDWKTGRASFCLVPHLFTAIPSSSRQPSPSFSDILSPRFAHRTSLSCCLLSLERVWFSITYNLCIVNAGRFVSHADPYSSISSRLSRQSCFFSSSLVQFPPTSSFTPSALRFILCFVTLGLVLSQPHYSSRTLLLPTT
jgi:hypothetical protein